MAIDLNNLTEMQVKAVMHEGGNILVSASAGSGKTKVLSLRVLRKLESGVDIDRLVILTFTRPAAEEMKERIRRGIADNPDLLTAEAKIDEAAISTFDAFALSIVRKYHYLLNLPSNIDIVDDAMLFEIREECLQETLDDFYERKEETFFKTVKRLFDRGDDTLAEAVRIAAAGLETLPDYRKYLENYEKEHFSEEAINSMISAFENYVSEKMAETAIIGRSYFHDSINPKVANYFSNTDIFYKNMESLDNIDKKIVFLKNNQFPHRLSGVKDVEEDELEAIKKTHDRAKKIYDGLHKTIDDLSVDSAKELAEDILETKEPILQILKIAKAFLERLEIVMQEKKMYHFGDVMRLAIKLFENNPDLRERFAAGINEIMVDEYQDTNDIQEYLLNLISRKNLFMVGDVKQSIYGFRNANPSIFRAKYHAYEKNEGGILIDLRENFRSRKEVIAYINAFFTPLMDENIGGIDYSHNQSMVYGQKKYEYQKKEHTGARILYFDPEERPKDEDKSRTEALIVAKDIRTKITNLELVTDKNTLAPRLLRYGDIAVIADRKTGFQTIAKTLVEMHIPIRVYTDEPFLLTEEVMLVWQFLQAASCLERNDFSDHTMARAFISIARSFAYQIKDDDIVRTFLENKLEDLNDFSVLKETKSFVKLAEDIEKISIQLNKKSLPDVVLSVFETTNAYTNLCRLSDPETCEKRLDYLYLKALEFEAEGFTRFLEYLNYIGKDKDSDISYENAAADESDMVKILSMHKSKGLEFPICYYVGLDKKFNFTENRNLFVFDREYGLVTKTWADGFKSNIARLLLTRKAKKEYISERIRLLYVAMTRSREEQIFILPISKEDDENTIYDDKGCIDFGTRESLMRYSQLFKLLPKLGANNENVLIEETLIPVETKIGFTGNGNSLTYMNPFWESHIIQQEQFSQNILKINSDNDKRAMEYGTLLHEIMEYVDFINPENSLLDLPDKQKNKILNMLSEEPFKSIRKMRIYREYPIFENTGSIAKTGIIDLLAVNEKEAIVVDYKSGEIDKEEYKEQIRGYAKIIHEKTNKPTGAYLCSLGTGEIRKVE